MNDKIRSLIWEMDKGVCQNCKKKLFKIIDPYEDVIEELLTLKEIPIFKWSKECWKCHKKTEVVTYDFAVRYNYHIGSIEKLDMVLMQKYPFVKRAFSKTMGSEVITNICINCGALQGNWFMMEDLLEMKCSDINMNKLIDIKLPNTLKFEDLPIDIEELKPFEEKSSFFAHVHHIDRNRENNEMDNLVLLCRDCHIRLHSDLRTLKKESESAN